MTQFDSGRKNGHESINLEPRTECALTECMTVLPDAPGLYTVVGENGNESYTNDSTGTSRDRAFDVSSVTNEPTASKRLVHGRILSR